MGGCNSKRVENRWFKAIRGLWKHEGLVFSPQRFCVSRFSQRCWICDWPDPLQIRTEKRKILLTQELDESSMDSPAPTVSVSSRILFDLLVSSLLTRMLSSNLTSPFPPLSFPLNDESDGNGLLPIRRMSCIIYDFFVCVIKVFPPQASIQPDHSLCWNVTWDCPLEETWNRATCLALNSLVLCDPEARARHLGEKEASQVQRDAEEAGLHQAKGPSSSGNWFLTAIRSACLWRGSWAVHDSKKVASW